MKPETTPCPCGKRHRRGTACPTAERMALGAAEAQRVLDLLRCVPEGTTVLHDTRAGRERARTLAAGDVLVRRYADGCEDSDWGEALTSPEGPCVRFTHDVGGYVPNSYGYPADCDEVHVVAGAGRVVVLLDRVRAQTRAGGRGVAVARLPDAERLRAAVARGVRYGSAYLVALREAERLHRLVGRPLPSLSPAEAVQRDQALEAGWVEAAPAPPAPGEASP